MEARQAKKSTRSSTSKKGASRQKKSVASTMKSDPKKIIQILKKSYPDAACALNFKSPLQLLVATILSAQCTDVRVNIVTKDLFHKYKTARDYAEADPAELEEDIRTTGFFRQKAKALMNVCGEINDNHGGQVPKNMDILTRMNGIGRKTANVVLGTAYGIATGVVVDTHVRRISNRLALTQHKDPDKIELNLIEKIPQKEWIDFSHRLIHHGRKICDARKPMCELCPLEHVCPKVGVT